MRLVLILTGLFGLGLVHAQTPTDPKQQAALKTAFLSACWSGDLSKVTLLFDEGAPIEGRDGLGRTPLFLASHGDPDVVKFLLAHGAKIDAAENDGDLPIAHACEFGDLASAQMLLDAGAEVQLGHVNKYGRTALMLAAREGRDALVSLLISHHVDVNFDGKSGSALFYAVWQDHLSTAKLLLDAGAKLPRSPEAMLSKDENPTVLMFAVWTNDLELIDLILDHGADINGAGGDGDTPLLAAVGSAEGKTVLHLLDKGADVNAPGGAGTTALMLATACQDVSIMQALLQHGAKLEATDQEGRTALMYACRRAVPPAVQFLVDQGAKVNAVDAHGDTALTYAGDRGEVDLVQYLKDKGAQPQDLHIIAKDKPPQPLSAAQSWALAVGAIYIQYNGESPLLLGGGNHDKRAVRELRDGWEITDKVSFIKEFEDLYGKGHRTEYQEIGVQLAALNESEFVDKLVSMAPADATQAKAIRASYLKWKNKTGLAWDLCRAVYLVDRGFAAHYLDEQGAWDLLMPIARQTQVSFSSWQEMNDNFLDGREIWDNKRDPHFEACARLLLDPKEPNSPWNQNPWKTDLPSTWSHAGG